MLNANAIEQICTQIEKASQRISSMCYGSVGFESTGVAELSDSFNDFCIGELEQLQLLTIALTKLLTDATNEPEVLNEEPKKSGLTTIFEQGSFAAYASDDAGDASAFSAGELNDAIGKNKKPENKNDA